MAKWPALLESDGEVEIPAQPCPFHGKRTVRVYVHYPEGELASVHEGTGLMLCLHNWGGRAFIGAPDPQALAMRYDLVCIGVDYLQSGEGAPPPTGFPYDTGYLQALDALRGLWYVYNGLSTRVIAFDAERLCATGGSGGGNVSLMVNKFAPRTFACIVNLSGPASLSDDVAYGLRADSEVNAGWSRDPASPNYLVPHAQQIRDAGDPAHLRVMRRLGNAATVVTVHGVDDNSCLVADTRRVMEAMRAAGVDVDAHYLTADDVDGDVIRDSAHSIGNRTQLVIRFAEQYLSPDSAELRRTRQPCDFEWRDQSVAYPAGGGSYVIDYADGFPVGRFEPRS